MVGPEEGFPARGEEGGVFAGEIGGDEEASRGDVFEEPGTGGVRVGEPDAEEFEVCLGEGTAAVVGAVDAEDCGTGHGCRE